MIILDIPYHRITNFSVLHIYIFLGFIYKFKTPLCSALTLVSEYCSITTIPLTVNNNFRIQKYSVIVIFIRTVVISYTQHHKYTLNIYKTTFTKECKR